MGCPKCLSVLVALAPDLCLTVALAAGRFGIAARGRVPGATGVWVGERKVAAIGVKISHGIWWAWSHMDTDSGDGDELQAHWMDAGQDAGCQ